MKTRENFNKYVNDFPWGQVVKVHEISDIQVVEFIEKDENKIKFYPFVNFKRLYFSCDSLDYAIIEAMARKYNGSNTQAGFYFWKMIH